MKNHKILDKITILLKIKKFKMDLNLEFYAY